MIGWSANNEFFKVLLSDKYPASIKINKIYSLLSRISGSNEKHKIGKEKWQGAMPMSKCLIQMTVVSGIQGPAGVKGEGFLEGVSFPVVL